tara:strand:+ start:264 stop:629 length:366 start_codon:yes stop_codon:yes gene_type:complete
MTILAMLYGCAGIPINTEIINQNSQTWKIENVTAFKSDGAIKVSGYFKKSKRFAARNGHIDVSAFSNEGKLLLHTIVPIGHRSMRSGGDYFSVNLLKKLPGNLLIKVEFHDQNSPNFQSSH